MKSELDRLKEKRFEQLQRLYSGEADSQQNEENEVKERIASLEALVKTRLTNDAWTRYHNLKIAYPERSAQLLLKLAQAIQQYNIKEITDAELRDLLQRITPQKRDFKITRK